MSGGSGDQGDQSGIVFVSDAMREVVARATRAAETGMRLLVTGETGTGKELMASLYHRMSPHKNGAFAAVNCATLSEGNAESDLFGAKGGHFTGVPKDQRGLMDRANGGVLFLDELGEMKPAIQAKLLRTLQEGTYIPAGGEKEKLLNMHLVCATNRNLKEAIRAGTFREDLYFRIAGCTVELPPLRERLEDLPVLVQHFCQKHDSKHAYSWPTTDAAISRLSQYPWPGNVRELADVVMAWLFLGEQEALRILGTPTALRSERSGGDGNAQYVRRRDLIQKALTKLRQQGLCTLLSFREGGGMLAARQIAAHCDGKPSVLLRDRSTPTFAKEEFFQQLTNDSAITSPVLFGKWLEEKAAPKGLLIIWRGFHGSPDLLEEAASRIFALRAKNPHVYLLAVGGEDVLRLLAPLPYNWSHLAPKDSFIEVPGLTLDEIAELLTLAKRPTHHAAPLHRITGGHPWLVHKLVTSGELDEEHALARACELLERTPYLARHADDPQAREIIEQLLRGAPLPQLGNTRHRYTPGKLALSRLYWDGLIMWDAERRCAVFRGEGAREVLGGLVRAD